MARRPTGALERSVLDTLWRSPAGLTPSEVRAAIDEDLAYTTVMTVLQRLWRKGSATRTRRGKAFVYQAAASEAEATAVRMRALLDQASDRQPVLSHFVENLSAEDENILRQHLSELGE